MNKKNKIGQVFLTVLLFFLITVFFCGCTENNSSNDDADVSTFIGAWTGNMKTSMFGFRGNGAMGNMSDFRNTTMHNMTDFMNISTSNITRLEFTADTLYMTITTDNETQTMSNTYSVEGNQIILSFDFSGERPNWEQRPSGGERPPFDGEQPFDGERSFNGENPQRGHSYIYQFNEDNTVLYLDDTPFLKVV